MGWSVGIVLLCGITPEVDLGCEVAWLVMVSVSVWACSRKLIPVKWMGRWTSADPPVRLPQGL